MIINGHKRLFTLLLNKEVWQWCFFINLRNWLVIHINATRYTQTKQFDYLWELKKSQCGSPRGDTSKKIKNTEVRIYSAILVVG
jgi:hypothetical protein